MRLTEVDLQKAKTEAESAIKTSLLLSGNTDNVKIFRSDSYLLGKNFQYANSFLHNGKRLTMSKSMEKLLSGLGGIPFPEGEYLQVPSFVDPRGPIYFNVTSKNNGASTVYCGKWTGVPAGLPVVEQELPVNGRLNNARLGVRYISKNTVPGPITYENSRDMFLMNYSEICFLCAEGAARGWNMNGTAKEWYERGIVASLMEAGISSNIIDLYLKSEMPNGYGTTVAFDKQGAIGDSQLDKIITQKYIANFPDNAWEAWNDYRRLNIPNLDPFVAPQPGYVVEPGARDWKGSVRRINYPPQESILNKVNYDLAVSRMGGDKTTTRMWWDAKK